MERVAGMGNGIGHVRYWLENNARSYAEQGTGNRCLIPNRLVQPKVLPYFFFALAFDSAVGAVVDFGDALACLSSSTRASSSETFVVSGQPSVSPLGLKPLPSTSAQIGLW